MRYRLKNNNEQDDPQRRELRILLVDDSFLISRMTEKMLAAQGRHVTIVFNGDEALRVLDSSRKRTYKRSFDVVIVDLSMRDASYGWYVKTMFTTSFVF